MNLGEFISAERTATRAFNAIRTFADPATRQELDNALQILAEARHFAVGIKTYEELSAKASSIEDNHQCDQLRDNIKNRLITALYPEGMELLHRKA